MNVKNDTGAPRRTCIRPSCVKKIPLYSISGRKKALHRLAEQTYCSNSCSRLHTSEMYKISQEALRGMSVAMDKFIYVPQERVQYALLHPYNYLSIR